MSKKRICKNCGGDVPEDRQSGTKYCKDSCKARYHEKKLMKELFHKEETPKLFPEKEKKESPQTKQPAVNLTEGLRGVLENKSSAEEVSKAQNEDLKGVQYADSEKISDTVSAPKLIPVHVKVETKNYKTAKEQIEKIQAEIKRVIGMINACDEQMQKIKNGSIPFFPASTIAVGGAIGYEKTYKNLLGAVGGGIVGWGTGALIDHLFFEDERKKEKKESLEKLQSKKSQWQNDLVELGKVGKAWQDYILTIPQHETKTEMRPDFTSKFKLLKWGKENNKQQEESNKSTEEKTEETENNSDSFFAERKFPLVQTNEKILSSQQLSEIDYKCLNFQGKWKDFFGQPAVKFHLAVHGKPGEGKSTFCIQFADYLARNFGNVVYISAEEGHSKTLRDKVINNKANKNPYLFFADIRSFDEIKTEIKNEYHFIFIDSLDTLRIDALKLRELKELYPQSAFITISQSTKDGKMRGSQEIIHDSDITAKVRSGFAVTEKNRFKQSGAELKVLDSREKPTNKIEEPGNIL